jgi:hypothetical protein
MRSEFGFEQIIGRSGVTREVVRFARRVAEAELTNRSCQNGKCGSLSQRKGDRK